MAVATAVGLGTAAVGMYSSRKQAKAAEKYAKNAEFRPYDVNTPYGSVDFANGAVSGQLSPEQMAMQQYLYGQGRGFLGQAGQLMRNGGVNPGMAGAYNQFNQSLLGNSQGFLNPLAQAGMGFMGQLGAMDPNQLAGDYTANLRAQAMPGQQRAVDKTVQGLFNSGRLGSTGGANILGGLAEAHNQQDLGFQKAGMDYAGSEQNRMAGLASGFMGQYQGLEESLNTRTNQRFQNAMQMFGLGQGNMGLGLATGGLGQGFLQQGQGIDQGLLQMIGMGGNLGSAQSGANATAGYPLMQAQQNQAGATGNFFGGLLSGIGGALGKMGNPGRIGSMTAGVSNNMYQTPNAAYRMA